MTNPTALKFGYPHTVVAETGQWLVLVRPQQPTYGSLVLVCKEPATAFAELSAVAYAELRDVVRGVERLLSGVVDYARINYLMLMMVDRDVHFHVIPRYDGSRELAGAPIRDAGWPGPPDLGATVALEPSAAAGLAASLRALWPDPA